MAPEPIEPVERRSRDHGGVVLQPQAFQVDLHGVVDLLSRHIYSSPQVYLRELLQNGRDAIAARRLNDPDTAFAGLIRVTPAPRPGEPLVFRDNGIGLSADEAGDLLSTVGRSSKRDEFLDLRREDYLGQFGIGLLSCFMVAEKIVVRSRSARGTPPIEWVGSAQGTFTVTTLSEADAAGLAVGTEVHLTARGDDADLLSYDRVATLLTRYGEYLTVPIEVATPAGGWRSINRPAVFLASPIDRDAALELGRELLGATPLDVIELSVPTSGTRGLAFILPFAAAPGARQSSRVYLGRMLLSERVDDLLPDWAFFVRCVLDTTGLAPTASREQLVSDLDLENTRIALGDELRRWLLRTAAETPHRLAELVAVHHVAMRALAVHDDELAALVIRWLSVETSAGAMSLEEYVHRVDRVRYTETVDEFRQIAAVIPTDAPIVNGGYLYDAELLRKLPSLVPGVTVERVSVADALDNLDVPPLDDRSLAVAFEQRASDVLADAGCSAVARTFTPADLPGLYVADPEVLRRMERHRAEGAAPPLWSKVLGQVDDVRSDATAPDARLGRLCLNWASPLVRTLARLQDEVVFARSVQLLYVQARLAGHQVLTRTDRGLLTSALTDLVHLSVGIEGDQL